MCRYKNRLKNFSSRHDNRGFSLLEILIALGVLASSLSILMTGVWSSLKFQTRDEEMLRAVHLANNKMAEVELEIEQGMERGLFPDNTSKEGEFEAPFDNYKWSYDTRKVEIPMMQQEGQNQMLQGVIKTVLKDISKLVRELKLRVYWQDEEDDVEREIVVTTHIVKLQ